MLRSSRTLDGILEQFARAEAARGGRLEPCLADVSVKTLFEGLCGVLAQRAPQLEVRWSVAAETAAVRTDVGLLETALADLAVEVSRRLGTRGRLLLEGKPGGDACSVLLRASWEPATKRASADGEQGGEPLDTHATAVRSVVSVLALIGSDLFLHPDCPELTLRCPFVARPSGPPGARRSLDPPYTPRSPVRDAMHHMDTRPEPGGTP